MKITNYLTPSHLLHNVSATDKYELLERLVHAVCQSPLLARSKIDEQQAQLAVREREEENSTALGEDIALPHARLPNFDGVGIAIATLAEPLDFGDGAKASIVCLVLAPQEQPTICLKVMAQLTKFFAQENLRRDFYKASGSEAALELLKQGDMSIDIPVYAKDIMEKPRDSVRKDTPLTEVTRYMYRNHLEVLPVVDEGNRILGEITCNRLFRFGLPDFFQQLKSVSFISEFDPFEKYFEEEAHSRACDLMQAEVSERPLNATLLEIVFDLAVKRYPQVYVVDAEGRWVGVINRATVLNKVISF